MSGVVVLVLVGVLLLGVVWIKEVIVVVGG